MPIHHDLEQQMRDFLVPFMLLNGVLGIAMLFVGYRVWTAFLVLMGLAIGFFFGMFLGATANPREPGVVFGLGALGAVVGAGLLAGIRPLGTFIVGGSVAIGVVAVLLEATRANRSIDPQAALAVVAVVFIVGGVIIAASGRGGIIVASSISGAQAVVATGSILAASKGDLSRAAMTPFTPVELGVLAVLAVVGMAVQFSTTSEPKRAQDPAVPSEPPVRPPAPTQATPNTGASGTINERLVELKRLRDTGLITEDEYLGKRKALLDQV